MIYLDANVFVLAALNNDVPGEAARAVLNDVQTGKFEAASSALTFDELVWAVKRNRSPQHAVVAGEAFLNMPRLKLVGVDGDILGRALGVMKKYELDPRDSIHAASAMTVEAGTLISSDRHFDRVKEVQRKDISHARSIG